MVFQSPRQPCKGPHRCPDQAALAGQPGDVRSVGKGVSELRIDYGPGYRVYFTRRGRSIAILLTGGDKRTQAQDILVAQQLAHNL